MYVKNIAAIAIGIMLTTVVRGQDSDPKLEEGAIKAAEIWLALLDEARYAESWELSANPMKNTVSKEQWIQSMESVRKLFGSPLDRNLKTSQYATSLPGAPDGHYVVIQFETSFEKKKAAVETLTPMLDSDGQWRVSGYYIK